MHLINKKFFLSLFFLILSTVLPAFGQEYLYSPPNGAVVESNCPIIRFSFPDQSVKKESVKIFLNKHDVTPSAIITGAFLMYMPLTPLADGKNDVKISFQDSQGKNHEKSWAFKINQTCSIVSIEHDAGRPLVEGESLKVKVTGKKGYRGSFDIEGFKNNMPLNETSPGVYEAEYPIDRGDYVENGILKARLIAPDGSQFTKTAKEPVNITARFLQVKIIEPKNESYVGQSFTISGRTKPDAIVFLSTTAGFAMGNSTFPMGHPGSFKVYADERGYFSYRFSFPVAVKGMMAIVKAWTIDDKGSRSMPDQTTVYIGSKGKK